MGSVKLISGGKQKIHSKLFEKKKHDLGSFKI